MSGIWYTGTCIILIWQKCMDIYVCMFVCLSPSLSSNTYFSWPLVAYGMRWTPSVQKLWTLWLNSFLSRKHKIEILDLIPVVMCNVSWISLHFSSPCKAPFKNPNKSAGAGVCWRAWNNYLAFLISINIKLMKSMLLRLKNRKGLVRIDKEFIH